MNPRRKKRLLAVTGIVALIAISVSLMLYSLNQNIDLFYTPSEIINGKDGRLPVPGQRLRVGGMVVEGSVEHDQKELAVTFNLVDVGPVVKIIYKGLLPDLFREGQGIVATGKLLDANTIMADEVLAKHDEEYMPPELAEAMKGIRHEKPKQIYDAEGRN
ncbi:cytochrome c maturation protein CcmE [Planctobacterium marinum]|uniref:cytochrome c maturation protein CcmE n=1 Tax=Planctobacterium marinum TaxID=1631968 RepID=UPI001E5EBC01|nr:cytochrome c maturation protein CcmE [Planctobacterium marinum]MCC2606171.1 cytochrome c maturation protein CcmE [Planctobacterium marinum]